MNVAVGAAVGAVDGTIVGSVGGTVGRGILTMSGTAFGIGTGAVSQWGSVGTDVRYRLL